RLAEIARRIDQTILTKRPTTSAATEHGAHERGVYVDPFQLNPVPVFTTIGGLHHKGASLFFLRQLVDVFFANEPAGFFVEEEDVADDCGRRGGSEFPVLPAVDGPQQRSLATDGPATIVIEKEN